MQQHLVTCPSGPRGSAHGRFKGDASVSWVDVFGVASCCESIHLGSLNLSDPWGVLFSVAELVSRKCCSFSYLDASAFPGLRVTGVCHLERWELGQGNIYVSLVSGKNNCAPGLVSGCERVYPGPSGPSVPWGVSSPGKLRKKKRRSFAGEILTFSPVSLPPPPPPPPFSCRKVSLPSSPIFFRWAIILSLFLAFSCWVRSLSSISWPQLQGAVVPVWEGLSGLGGNGDSPRKGMNWGWTVSAGLTATLSDDYYGADGCCQGNFYLKLIAPLCWLNSTDNDLNTATFRSPQMKSLCLRDSYVRFVCVMVTNIQSRSKLRRISKAKIIEKSYFGHKYV